MFFLLYLQVRNNQKMSEKCQNFEKNSSQKHGRPQKLLQGGETRYFAHPFHVADDATQMHVHKMLCPFYIITNMPHTAQRRNEGGQGRHNSPGAESQWGRQIAVGGAIKSQQCHKHILQYSTFASERPQVRTWGRQTCFLPRAPSDLVTPLLLRQQSQKLRFIGAAMVLFHLCFFSHCTVQNYEAYRY